MNDLKTTIVLQKLYKNSTREGQVYEDDVWICSFPKSGTTWTQEITWCLLNDIDIETAEAVESDSRVVFVEFSAIAPPALLATNLVRDSVDAAAQLPRPRIIKTHLPMNLLPKQIFDKSPKIVHLSRNVRDVCVSYFYHMQIAEAYSGKFDEWCDLFLNGYCTYYCPVKEHLKSYIKSDYQSDKIIFLEYEKMKRNISGEIMKLTKFLGKVYPIHEIARLVDYQHFENLKNVPTVNKEQKMRFVQHLMNNNIKGSFMRKGIVGDWKTHLSYTNLDKFKKLEHEIQRSTGVQLKLE